MVTYFSFEIDTLEIVLKEHLDVVDMFFIGSFRNLITLDIYFISVEANVTHKGRSKPMLWNLLKKTKRFKFADSDKVKPILLYHSNPSQDDMW